MCQFIIKLEKRLSFVIVLDIICYVQLYKQDIEHGTLSLKIEEVKDFSI